jgi:hypothetical protein
MRRSAPLLALALAACSAGEVRLDIDSVAPALSPMLPADAPAGALAYDVTVRAGQLRAVLDARGAPAIRIVRCAEPDGEGETPPVYFGGEPLAGLSSRQLSDDPDMLVQLNVAIPRAAVAPGRCLRFIGNEGMMRPAITGRPVPIPAVPDQAAV